MCKIGQQKHCYRPLIDPHYLTAMDRYLTRPQSPTLPTPADPFTTMNPSLGTNDTDNGASLTHYTHAVSPQATQTVLTPELLDVKLQAL